jgi:flagellar protein FliJ
MTRTFALAGLLRLRGIQEDQAAAELSTANARSRAIHARKSAARLELQDGPVDVSSVKALHMAAISRASSRSMLADLLALEAVQAEETAAAQTAFIAAQARTAGLEKLEAKHKAGVAAADLSAEQTALDEIASGALHRLKEASTL